MGGKIKLQSWLCALLLALLLGLVWWTTPEQSMANERECLRFRPWRLSFAKGAKSTAGRRFALPPPGYIGMSHLRNEMPIIDEIEQSLVFSFRVRSEGQSGRLTTLFKGFKDNEQISSQWTFDLNYNYYETDFTPFSSYPNEQIAIEFKNVGQSEIVLSDICLFIASRPPQRPS